MHLESSPSRGTVDFPLPVPKHAAQHPSSRRRKKGLLMENKSSINGVPPNGRIKIPRIVPLQ
jgi:hypothetical protein